ncbi:MAG: Peroxide operon regulator [Syntrophorhabdus sp. PtaU1.Bin153]|nr:MAG: Peroxide operon regulator [Syntrophorhabdus sp. PtaU1.Bin153]
MDDHKRTTMKLTPQRLAILEYLENNGDHPSASDIYSAVSERFPTMSFATVYNTLRTLKMQDAVRELAIDPDKKRFDPNTGPHHHLICIRCRRIVDIHSEFSVGLTEGEKCGFEITGNHVDFYGLCPVCKNSGEKAPHEGP